MYIYYLYIYIYILLFLLSPHIIIIICIYIVWGQAHVRERARATNEFHTVVASSLQRAALWILPKTVRNSLAARTRSHAGACNLIQLNPMKWMNRMERYTNI